jgi:molybdopterin converting factor small subunit
MTVVLAVGPLRDALGGRRLVIEASTVRAALRALGSAAYDRIVEAEGAGERIRPFVAVFVNGEAASLETPLRSEDELTILPSVSGGAIGAAEATREPPEGVLSASDRARRGGGRGAVGVD